MPPKTRPTVLVVDDEPEVADVYALRLDSDYETRVAYSGEAALDTIDDEIDVVLLDRRMPNLSGDELLDIIRSDGYDCRVIMLTAVDPGLDIVELPFDDYLCKPVEKDDLVAAIEQQLEIKRHDERVIEYLELRAKQSLLSADSDEPDADKLVALQERMTQLRAELNDGEREALSDLEEAFVSVNREP